MDLIWILINTSVLLKVRDMLENPDAYASAAPAAADADDAPKVEEEEKKEEEEEEEEDDVRRIIFMLLLLLLHKCRGTSHCICRHVYVLMLGAST